MPASGSVPSLTIGLPVYNGESYLEQTLTALLTQSFSDFELIISDNASTDSTEKICREFERADSRIRYHRAATNRGAAWNFNNAFHLGRGKYFKWSAHDDLHAPTFIEECIAVLEHDSSVVLCFTGTEFIDADGSVFREYPFPVRVNDACQRDLFRLYAGGGHIVHEIFGVIRASVLRTTPLIDSYVGSDLVLLGRLALQGRFHQVDKPLFMHREHSGRSSVATGDAQGYTNWFDASKSGRFATPFWRRIWENTRSVFSSPVPFKLKVQCLLEIARTAYWNRAALIRDITRLWKR